MRGTERSKFGQQPWLRVEASHGGRGPRDSTVKALLPPLALPDDASCVSLGRA